MEKELNNILWNYYQLIEECRHSIYWTQARTWPAVQRGQASNWGLDGEETQSAGCLANAVNTPWPSCKGLNKAGLLNC